MSDEPKQNGAGWVDGVYLGNPQRPDPWEIEGETQETIGAFFSTDKMANWQPSASIADRPCWLAEQAIGLYIAAQVAGVDLDREVNKRMARLRHPEMGVRRGD